MSSTWPGESTANQKLFSKFRQIHFEGFTGLHRHTQAIKCICEVHKQQNGPRTEPQSVRGSSLGRVGKGKVLH